jgi:sugar transferase (PEP-CTERM/EpsH1 system associated)
MANILFLVHRLPYPPNKGDKVRSYHLLKHLARQHRVFLGTFIDDPDDEAHVATLRDLCADIHVVRLDPRLAKMRSLGGFLSGEALTLSYYRSSALRHWVEETCKRRHIDAAVVFSSAMAQYVEDLSRMPTIIDFVDVDSAKWTQYAPRHRWPFSWLYRREGRLLLDYERRMAARASRSFFATDNEVALFAEKAPECKVRLEAMGNGVDSEYFSPEESRPSPYGADELPITFTGAMDYLPNIDAVTWFKHEVFPGILERWPNARFYIVGRNPPVEVLKLAGEHTVVTGTVGDVRPYLQYAAAVVAPLRIARGIQNKILEAMAMGRPVIASTDCAAAVDAAAGRELLTASSPQDYTNAIIQMLEAPEVATDIGNAARQRVSERYSWEAHMKAIDPYLPPPSLRQA